MTTTQRHIGGALALMFATIFGTAWADATPHAGTADAPYADTVIGSAPAGALPITVSA